MKRSGRKSKGGKRSVTYRTEREEEVSKILIISLLCLRGSGTISINAERNILATKTALNFSGAVHFTSTQFFYSYS